MFAFVVSILFMGGAGVASSLGQDSDADAASSTTDLFETVIGYIGDESEIGFELEVDDKEFFKLYDAVWEKLPQSVKKTLSDATGGDGLTALKSSMDELSANADAYIAGIADIVKIDDTYKLTAQFKGELSYTYIMYEEEWTFDTSFYVDVTAYLDDELVLKEVHCNLILNENFLSGTGTNGHESYTMEEAVSEIQIGVRLDGLDKDEMSAVMFGDDEKDVTFAIQYIFDVTDTTSYGHYVGTMEAGSLEFNEIIENGLLDNYLGITDSEEVMSISSDYDTILPILMNMGVYLTEDDYHSTISALKLVYDEFSGNRNGFKWFMSIRDDGEVTSSYYLANKSAIAERFEDIEIKEASFIEDNGNYWIYAYTEDGETYRVSFEGLDEKPTVLNGKDVSKDFVKHADPLENTKNKDGVAYVVDESRDYVYGVYDGVSDEVIVQNTVELDGKTYTVNRVDLTRTPNEYLNKLRLEKLTIVDDTYLQLDYQQGAEGLSVEELDVDIDCFRWSYQDIDAAVVNVNIGVEQYYSTYNIDRFINDALTTLTFKQQDEILINLIEDDIQELRNGLIKNGIHYNLYLSLDTQDEDVSWYAIGVWDGISLEIEVPKSIDFANEEFVVEYVRINEPNAVLNEVVILQDTYLFCQSTVNIRTLVTYGDGRLYVPNGTTIGSWVHYLAEDECEYALVHDLGQIRGYQLDVDEYAMFVGEADTYEEKYRMQDDEISLLAGIQSDDDAEYGVGVYRYGNEYRLCLDVIPEKKDNIVLSIQDRFGIQFDQIDIYISDNDEVESITIDLSGTIDLYIYACTNLKQLCINNEHKGEAYSRINIESCDRLKNISFNGEFGETYIGLRECSEVLELTFNASFEKLEGNLSTIPRVEEIVFLGEIGELDYLLNGSSSLKKVVFKEYVGEVYDTFSECRKLSEVTFEKGIGEIGRWTFIDNATFYEDGCLEITIQGDVDKIASYAFRESKVKFNLSDNTTIQNVKNFAFDACEVNINDIIPHIRSAEPNTFFRCLQYVDGEQQTTDEYYGILSDLRYSDNQNDADIEYALCLVDGQLKATIFEILESSRYSVISL